MTMTSSPTAVDEHAAYQFPASFAQSRLWFLDRLQPGTAANTVCSTVRMSGLLDALVLEQSVQAIVARHEALRTTFTISSGELMQVIAPHCACR